MSISVDIQAAESYLVVEVDWGNLGSTIKYADKNVSGYSLLGRILQANVVSKTGQIGQSGVSKTMSVTLSDRAGTLKAVYNTKVIYGSKVDVYQYIENDAGLETVLLMSGYITSDIKWSEGERTLSFSVEGGTTKSGDSGEIGYAPPIDAYAEFNNNAAGKNWPIVFGTAVKVPAVRVEYLEDMEIMSDYSYVDDTFEITNGDQLPQAPAVITVEIGGIVFKGTMSGTTMTLTEKNYPKYVNQDFEIRPSSDEDFNNPCVAWIGVGVFIQDLYIYINHPVYGPVVNQCVNQYGQKCYFANAWYNNQLLDDTWTFDEAAKFERSDWDAVMITLTDGGNLMTMGCKDCWKLWRGAPVIYDTGLTYVDRYIVNLYPSDEILAVYGRRKWNGKDVWAKIPSSYYTKQLDLPIVTEPGSIYRHVTALEFPKKLSDYICENWYDEVYVTLRSTLLNSPKDIFEWVTNEFTNYTFGDAASDDPPITMNFAYFNTSDALDFLRELAFQATSVMHIDAGILYLRQLSKVPGSDSIGNVVHLEESIAIAKSLEMGFKAAEEVNTHRRSKYVIDYSGRVESAKIYEKDINISAFGSTIKEQDMWALTCYDAVKAVTDFWANKLGNSWKTIKLDCFLDISDTNVFDGATFDITPFIPAAAKGLLTSVVHDTDRPMVTVEVELDVPAGTSTPSADYWNLGPAICIAAVDTEEDYVPPPDPVCPVYTTTYTPYTKSPRWHIAITWMSPFMMRGVPFSMELRLHNSFHEFIEVNTMIPYIGKLYTDSPTDCFIVTNIVFIAGICQLDGLIIKRSMFTGRIHLSIDTQGDDRVMSGNVHFERPEHL